MDSRIRMTDDDVCQTLNTRMGTGGGNVPLILIVDDQGGGQISWSAEGLVPTIRAEAHGHPPLIYRTDEETFQQSET